MPRTDRKLPKAVSDLNEARAEFDRMMKDAIDHPAKVNRQQFWEAMQRIANAKRTLARLGTE